MDGSNFFLCMYQYKCLSQEYFIHTNAAQTWKYTIFKLLQLNFAKAVRGLLIFPHLSITQTSVYPIPKLGDFGIENFLTDLFEK